jgi:hypothetical protein
VREYGKPFYIRRENSEKKEGKHFSGKKNE